MRIAIEGCTHGELDKIYQTIAEIETNQNYKVDMLICCGDFQSTRNLSDLKCMACPDKYKDMCSFYKYYSGEAIAPLLTVFIGGNHEASNYLQELAFGGWVAPNIYYLGYAGVIDVNGVRIGGLSGIFKGFDYLQGHHEKPPYDDNTMRSCYHIRNVDVFRLKQLASNPPDIMLSHDWPRSVTNHGNADQLMRFKKHFRDEIEQDKLGSGPTKEIMDVVQPKYWFAAHLHCKFAALVEHESGATTKFLALDKCLPGRRFLQVIEVGAPVTNEDISLKYDKDWLSILKNTNHLTSVEKKTRYTPGPGCSERFDFTPTAEEIDEINNLFNNDLEIPYNFEQSVLGFRPNGARINMSQVSQPHATINRQTTEFCVRLGIHDPMALLIGAPAPKRNNSNGSAYSLNKSMNYINEREANISLNSTVNPDEISINEDDDVVVESEKVLEDKPKEAAALRPSISLPAPQLDSDDVDLEDVLNTSNFKDRDVLDTSDIKGTSDLNDTSELNSSADNGDKSEVKDNSGSLFFIDASGTDGHEFTKPLPAADPGPMNSPPVKKLKRRNAALYTSDE